MQLDKELVALASYLRKRNLSAPDAVSLLTRMNGEILSLALRGGHTDAPEVERTVTRMAQAIRKQTGVSAGATLKLAQSH